MLFSDQTFFVFFAAYLTLHSAADDFHASIPLAAVRDRAMLIYELDGAPLPTKAGGPLRFLIPDDKVRRPAAGDSVISARDFIKSACTARSAPLVSMFSPACRIRSLQPRLVRVPPCRSHRRHRCCH